MTLTAVCAEIFATTLPWIGRQFPLLSLASGPETQPALGLCSRLPVDAAEAADWRSPIELAMSRSHVEIFALAKGRMRERTTCRLPLKFEKIKMCVVRRRMHGAVNLGLALSLTIRSPRQMTVGLVRPRKCGGLASKQDN